MLKNMNGFGKESIQYRKPAVNSELGDPQQKFFKWNFRSKTAQRKEMLQKLKTLIIELQDSSKKIIDTNKELVGNLQKKIESQEKMIAEYEGIVEIQGKLINDLEKKYGNLEKNVSTPSKN